MLPPHPIHLKPCGARAHHPVNTYPLDGRGHGRVLERVVGQLQVGDPAELERPQFGYHLAAQDHGVAVLDQHVQLAGRWLYGVRVEVQPLNATYGHHQVRFHVLDVQALALDRHLGELGHVERPQPAEHRECLDEDGQIAAPVTVQLQRHQGLIQVAVVVVLFQSHVLKTTTNVP